MNCHQARENMFEFVRGELGEDEMEQMRAHLKSCEECTAQVDSTTKVLDLMIAASETPVAEAVEKMLLEAIPAKASDIHVEPKREGVRVRYRVDGVLHDAMTFAREMGPAIVTRIKHMAEMNVAETRTAQDGRMEKKIGDKQVDIRVSSIPSVYGEALVLRVLSRSDVLLGLEKLGPYPDQLAQLKAIMRCPSGLFFATGPTGSGKTTLLYSMLREIDSETTKVMTIEDPVEYLLRGCVQAQVQKSAGFTFASGLRAFLRHDPDVIMVGAMRDLETAEIGIEASVTGHLVLSALHTNDAPSALIRLVDMGVEPYLVRAAVIGVVAQRLARRICDNCKVAYQAQAKDLREFGFAAQDPEQQVTLYRGEGCDACRHTGYSGRTGIFELMTMSAEVGDLLTRRAPLADIRDAARANGMRDLREDGLRKVLDGVTTPDEVMRVVFTAGG